MELTDYRIRKSSCPHCGRKFGAAAGMGGRRPRTGDVMVCVGCSHVAIWDEGRMHDPTGDEVLEIAGDPELIKVVGLLALAKARYEAGHPGKRWEDIEH